MADLGRILIVDDEETFLEAHADLLRDEGYECDCAQDAHFAKERLRQNRYDLMIADIKMPGNDELEFIEELPAIAEGLPVILVTGYPSLNTAIKSTRLSVAGYLVKPVPIDDFLKLVRQAVIRHQTLRMFDAARKRLQNVHEEMGSLEILKNLSPGSPSYVDVDVFLHYTLNNVIASMIDLKDLTQALAQNRPKQQVCQLLNCPRHAELTEAIKDAIFVLEKTKSAFKSKELAVLREKLERVLGQND
jgi:CheY-like chemotaxis protein